MLIHKELSCGALLLGGLLGELDGETGRQADAPKVEPNAGSAPSSTGMSPRCPAIAATAAPIADDSPMPAPPPRQYEPYPESLPIAAACKPPPVLRRGVILDAMPVLLATGSAKEPERSRPIGGACDEESPLDLDGPSAAPLMPTAELAAG
mmetsp:Transcript_165487/g.526116  ORF Transcript_165487/g.526116 Transcript_165487/m.526116 type:complete len:151 (+) Transcript_165487:227-679(+)